MVSEQTIKILALAISTVLATVGWIRNDLIYLIPAIIISPIGSVLNDIAFSAVNVQIISALYNLLLLGIMAVLGIVISFRLGKISEINIDTLRKTDKFDEIKWIHLVISVIVGIFTAILLSTPTVMNKISCVIIGMVATILTPLIDVGIVSSMASTPNKIDTIFNDLKICLTNVVGFTLGAGLVHYYYHIKSK